jgi:hypothetical protein
MSGIQKTLLKHEKGAEGTTRVRDDFRETRVRHLQGELERKRAE